MPALADTRIQFNQLINSLTQDFSGREWVLDELNSWLGDPNGPRTFLLTGEPGSGKSAIAARLAQFSHEEIPQPEGLTHIAPGFLSAVHFCSARDHRWINPHTFVASLALQLSRRYSAFARTLAEQGGEGHIHIEVQQKVQRVDGGAVTGIVIERLNTSRVTLEQAFGRLVREPLEALFQAERDSRVVILVDALDEALQYTGKVGVDALLSRGMHLPKGVRFILTSRRDERVENQFLNAHRFFLSSDEFDAFNREDIHEYVGRQLREDSALHAQSETLTDQHAWAETMSAKADGNFQYVRFLLREMAAGQRSLTDLDGLPQVLGALYYDSLDRVVGPGRWRDDYAPVLGCLAVAQQELTIAQLERFTRLPEKEVWKRLGDVQQFVEEVAAGENMDEVGYRLYHQSMIDFFSHRYLQTENEKTRLRNGFYLSTKTWHRVIADYYRDAYGQDWKRCDAYGLSNLASHLHGGGQYEKLFKLIGRGWMEARYTADGYTYSGFQEDVSRAWQAAVEAERTDVLSRLWVARHVIQEQVGRYNDENLKTLVWMGRHQEALTHVRLRRESQARFEGLLPIFDALTAVTQQASGRSGVDVDRLTNLSEAVQDEALEIARSMNDSYSRALALKRVASVLAQAGRFEEALEVARSIEAPVLCAGALSHVARALAQAGDPRTKSVLGEALEVAHSIDGSYRVARAESLSEVAEILAKTGDSRVGAVLEEALEAARSMERGDHNVLRALALSRLARVFAETGRFEEALEVARSVDNGGVRAGAVGRVVGALAVADRLEEIREIVRMLDDSFSPVLAQREVAGALADAGRLEEAVAVARAIDTSSPIKRDDALAKVAGALAQAERFEEALEVASLTEEGYVQRPSVLSEVASALARAGDDRAKSVLEMALKATDLLDDGVVVQGEVANALADAGRFEEAVAVARAIDNSPVRVSVLSNAAGALAQVDGARSGEVFEEALGTARTIEDSGKRAEALTRIAEAMAQTGRIRTALEVSRSIKNSWSRHNAFSHVARALGKAGRFEEALKVARSIGSSSSWWPTFLLKLTTRPAGDYHRAVALSGIAVELAETGRFNDALGIARSIDDDENRLQRAWALSNVTRALAHAGHFKEALETVHTIDSGHVYTRYEIDALSEIAGALAQANRLEEALKVASAIDRPKRAEALSNVAGGLVRVGRFEEALEVSQAIDDSYHRAEALRPIAGALAQAGQLEKALEIARSINNTSWRSWALGEVAGGLVRAGDARLGTVLFEEMLMELDESFDDLPREDLMRKVAGALAQGGRFAEAFEVMTALDMSRCLQTLVEWAPYFERVKPGFSIDVLREATGVAGWVRSDWEAIHNLLAAPASSMPAALSTVTPAKL